jgi:alginate O-acetyltransferase complex protein AlgI
MWLLSIAIFAGCKWLTWQTARDHDTPHWKQAAYILAWPGLDAVTFMRPMSLPQSARPRLHDWLFAAMKLAIGLLLIVTVSWWMPTSSTYLRGCIGMAGLVFTLHFGLFDLLSCFWRRAGIDARPLMDWPLLSVSVTEFWGKRWNRAFRDLTHRFLFRPLTARYGPQIAMGLGFLFSGLVHEFVITVPAGGGYGGPTLFFLIQGLAIFVERSTFGQQLGLGTGVRGWLFVACVMLLPVYWLFPPAFLEEIIVPFLAALGVMP